MLHSLERNTEIKERVTCRICESHLESLFYLGDFYLSDFITEGEETYKTPLELVICKNKECNLVQLKHSVPYDIMYRKYWYKSGLNPVIVNDLKEIAEQAVNLSKIKKGETFIDVGANDGTLLSFVPDKFRRIGVEPAKNLQKELKQHAIAIPIYWEKYESDFKAKVITAIGMFYDSENPNKFIGNVAKHLTDDGLFVAQLMTLHPMIENNDLGNICHEHLEYYSYKSLKNLYERNGLEIFRVDINDINGGSYRIFARKLKKGSIYFKEKEYDKDDFQSFFERIKNNRNQVNSYIGEAISKKRKVYGYGASTKGNTILQFYKLDGRLIKGIADKNKDKIGKRTIGTNIPIVSEEKARADADVFFVLPWGFKKLFLEREKEWRRDNRKFITHTPSFEIL